MWESGWEGGGLYGWDGLWLEDETSCSGADRLQQTTRLLVAPTFFHLTQPGDTVVWLMTSLYSVRLSPSFISIHHTVHKHIYSLLTALLQSTSWLTTSSQLHQDVHKKSKQLTTTSIHAHSRTSKSPLTHIFTDFTHPFTQGIFLAAWPIRFPDQSISQSQKTPSHRSSSTFSISLQLKPRLPQPPGAKCTCLPDVQLANASKGR